MNNYRQSLVSFVDCYYTGKILRRIVFFYATTCIFCLIILGFKAWHGIGTISAQLVLQKTGTIGLSCIVGGRVYINFLNLLASGFIEILCSTLSFVVVRVIKNIQNSVLHNLAGPSRNGDAEKAMVLFPPQQSKQALEI
jgi:hypothetical protein